MVPTSYFAGGSSLFHGCPILLVLDAVRMRLCDGVIAVVLLRGVPNTYHFAHYSDLALNFVLSKPHIPTLSTAR